MIDARERDEDPPVEIGRRERLKLWALSIALAAGFIAGPTLAAYWLNLWNL